MAPGMPGPDNYTQTEAVVTKAMDAAPAVPLRPRRSAAPASFKEERVDLGERYAKVRVVKEENAADEDKAVLATSKDLPGPVGELPQRRLLDFQFQTQEGKPQSLSAIDREPLFISALVVPFTGPLDKKHGVRCEGFGAVIEWKLGGVGGPLAAGVWVFTQTGAYLCAKPAGTYKRLFTPFEEMAELCAELYRGLVKAQGGDPEASLDELLAKIARETSGKAGRRLTRDAFLKHGVALVEQLAKLDKKDKKGKGTALLWEAMPALVSLKEQAVRREAEAGLPSVNVNGGIVIKEREEGAAPAELTEDEKLARKLQAEANKVPGQRRRAAQPKQKVYIKISEDEIADDYPEPTFYKMEDEEMDEYLLNEDDITLPEHLPRRILSDFVFYNSDHRLIPLEVLPMLANVETDVEIFGSGQMTEDDGNADWQGEEAVLEVAPGPVTTADASGSGAGSSAAGASSSGGASSSAGAGSSSGAGGSSASGSAPSEKEGIRLYLGAVKEWMIEFGAGMLFLSIRTDGAWYRLSQPSPQYERWYQPVLKTARLAIKIITMLKAESRVSRLCFADVIKRLAEQPAEAPTFVSSKLGAVEKYCVVHGQIILQQLREYPDKLIQQSAFGAGLVAKMEARQHTKLALSKKKLKVLRGRNRNPSANNRPDATKRRPMRATTTELVHRIWAGFYAEKAAEEARGAAAEGGADEEIREVEDVENEEQEEETVLAGDSGRRRGLQSPLGKRKAAVKVEWAGKPIGTGEKNCALYAAAVVGGNEVRVGAAVAIGEEGAGGDVLPDIVVVQYLYEGRRGEKMLHGRSLERGADTVLGNAANERELFLVDRCVDVALETVLEPVVATRRVRPFSYLDRKENAALDQADAERARVRKEAGEPTEYFYRALYKPEMGAFVALPDDDEENERARTGECPVCDEERREAERLATVVLPDGKGFRHGGISYCVGDFCYLAPATLPDSAASDDDDDADVISHKGSRNVGIRPFQVARLEGVAAAAGRKGEPRAPGKLRVRRFLRAEDTGMAPEEVYRHDTKEVVYSEVVRSVDVSSVVGRCEVRRPSEIGDLAAYHERDNTFVCVAKWDAKARAKKQLDADIILGGTEPMETCEAPARARAAAKGKGKAVEGAEDMDTEGQSGDDGKLATLDIFAGCGGLSEGLQQSGVSRTRWAIEYEQPAADAFKLNHPDAEVFCENCNVVLRAAMEEGGDAAGCKSTPEAEEGAAAFDADKRARLPRPGQVDFINGGPPCQGFSGMNRFNTGAWSKVQCEMILAFLSFADYFRPRFFLLENVRNFVSFNKGQTFRLTLASLLEMGYQVRFGVLQAGNYGVSQSRKRAFIWAAAPGEVLPEWPEPSHVFLSAQLKVTLPGGIQYAAVRDGREGAPLRSVTVRDTIGDLPPVTNGAAQEDIPYGEAPVSTFQRAIRGDETRLVDHIAKEMNELNLLRCQHVPRETAGADWRVLKTLPTEVRMVTLSNGQVEDLVPWCLPNTAERHNEWKGLFGRLDWNGNFPTSVTDPQPMGKVGMCFHPYQDRIVTVRECARSQGFPDRYRFSGTIQAKHRQIGNAVPPPLAKALGKKLKEAVEKANGY